MIVPLGLDLRGGVVAKIDNGKPIKLDYMSCLQIGCTAEVKLPAGTLDADEGRQGNRHRGGRRQ